MKDEAQARVTLAAELTKCYAPRCRVRSSLLIQTPNRGVGRIGFYAHVCDRHLVRYVSEALSWDLGNLGGAA